MSDVFEIPVDVEVNSCFFSQPLPSLWLLYVHSVLFSQMLFCLMHTPQTVCLEKKASMQKKRHKSAPQKPLKRFSCNIAIS